MSRPSKFSRDDRGGDVRLAKKDLVEGRAILAFGDSEARGGVALRIRVNQ